MELKDIVLAGIKGGNDEAKEALKGILTQKAQSMMKDGKQYILASLMQNKG